MPEGSAGAAGTAGTAGSALEHDHHVIDSELAAFRAGLVEGEVRPNRFATGAQGLRDHIWVEEELHFPRLREQGLVGPILVMLREHGQIWDGLATVDGQIAGGDPAAQILPTVDALLGTLEAHNLKEERIVYPAGDQVLDATVNAEIVSALSSPTRPAGWACEMASSSQRDNGL